MDIYVVVIDENFDHTRDFRTEDVDRRLAVGITWRDYDPQLRKEMLAILAAAATESFPPEVEAHVRGAAYHVGPMAQGPTIQMLFTAYEDIRPIVNDTASWLAVGGFALLVVNRTRALLRRFIADHGAEVTPYPGVYLRDDQIVLSQPLIQGLCFQHFMKAYGDPKQRVSTDVIARSPYEGIVWAGRPDGSMVYTVRIRTGQTSYVYVIDGRGDPIDHFSIRGSTLTSLPMPDWVEDPRSSAVPPVS